MQIEDDCALTPPSCRLATTLEMRERWRGLPAHEERKLQTGPDVSASSNPYPGWNKQRWPLPGIILTVPTLKVHDGAARRSVYSHQGHPVAIWAEAIDGSTERWNMNLMITSIAVCGQMPRVPMYDPCIPSAQARAMETWSFVITTAKSKLTTLVTSYPTSNAVAFTTTSFLFVSIIMATLAAGFTLFLHIARHKVDG